MKATPGVVFCLGVLRFISFVVLRLPIAPYTIYYALKQVGGLGILYNEMSKTPVLSLQVTAMILLFGTLNVVWTRASLKSSVKLWNRWRDEGVKKKGI
jgi:hypothetical protein